MSTDSESVASIANSSNSNQTLNTFVSAKDDSLADNFDTVDNHTKLHATPKKTFVLANDISTVLSKHSFNLESNE